MTTSELPVDPVTPPADDDLAELVRRLCTSVEGARDDFKGEKTARLKEVAASRRVLHWVIAVGGFALLFAIIFGTGVVVQNGRLRDQSDRLQAVVDAREADQVQQAVVSCQNGNGYRAATLSYIDGPFLDSLAKLGNPTTPEAQAALAARMRQLRTDLAAIRPDEMGPRDCSIEAVTKLEPSPTTTRPTAG